MFDKKMIVSFMLLLGVSIFNANADQCAHNSSEIMTIYFGVEIDLPHPDHPDTVPEAHTDIEIPLRFTTGWDIHIKTELPTEDTRIETEDALFPLYTRHRNSFAGSVPPAFQFIGAGPDETFWYCDQSDSQAAGFDSQDITLTEKDQLCIWDPNDPAGNIAGFEKWLQINLVDVRGPAGGHVAMFQESGPTPTVFFSTYNGGITDKDVFFIRANQHVHCGWTFTKPGLYEVDFKVSTYHLCDESLLADINNDCIVNLEDFALLASQWLLCGSSFGANCP